MREKYYSLVWYILNVDILGQKSQHINCKSKFNSCTLFECFLTSTSLTKLVKVTIMIVNTSIASSLIVLVSVIYEGYLCYFAAVSRE